MTDAPACEVNNDTLLHLPKMVTPQQTTTLERESQTSVSSLVAVTSVLSDRDWIAITVFVPLYCWPVVRCLHPNCPNDARLASPCLIRFDMCLYFEYKYINYLFPVLCHLLSDLLGLRNKLLSLLSSLSLCPSCCCILCRAQSFPSFFRQVTFSSLAWLLSRLCSPVLFSPFR